MLLPVLCSLENDIDRNWERVVVYGKHWRQPGRGCRGHIPQIFWLGGRQREYPPQYYYVLSDIADQYWLTSVRSASSRFHSAIRRHQFASVRQEDSRLTRLVPPNLELALTPLMASNNNTDHATLSVCIQFRKPTLSNCQLLYNN